MIRQLVDVFRHIRSNFVIIRFLVASMRSGVKFYVEWCSREVGGTNLRPNREKALFTIELIIIWSDVMVKSVAGK